MPFERVTIVFCHKRMLPGRTNFTQLQAIIREQAYHFMV